MLQKLKDFDSNATRDTVLRKINNLRSSLRRELKNVQVSKTSGTASEDIYKSELWYFDHMMFLCDQELPKPSTSSIADDVSQVKDNKCCYTQTIYL